LPFLHGLAFFQTWLGFFSQEMLGNPGPSEKVLISRVVERKSSKQDCNVWLELCRNL